MTLNTGKSKIMNIGRMNQGGDYIILGPVGERYMLTTAINERDLDMKISKDFKPNDQVCKVASAANRVLGMLRNTFVSRDTELWKKL